MNKKSRLKAGLYLGIASTILFIFTDLILLEAFTTTAILKLLLIDIFSGALFGFLFGYLMGVSLQWNVVKHDEDQHSQNHSR